MIWEPYYPLYCIANSVAKTIFIDCRIVDPETAVEMLHRASPQVPPLGVTPTSQQAPSHAQHNRPPPLMPPSSGRTDMRNFPRGGSADRDGNFGSDSRVLPASSFNDERRDPRSRDPRDRAINGGSDGGPGAMFRNGQGMDAGLPAPNGGSGQLPPHLAGADPEKAQLIMQVLQLTDEQIAMLPQAQRESIMILKEQISQGQR